jgi:Pyruvate/2-oxoacid:ferredoxin oxidoreductase delta subunit
MNNRWSASRFGCWSSCKQKYKFVYEDEKVVVGRDSELAVKGLSFHQIAEAMDSTKTEANLYEYAKKILDEADFDQEKYPVIKSIPRFYLWWQTYIKPYEEQGYTLYKENWENSKLDESPMVGAIYALLVSKDKKSAIIIDYKTAATAKVDGYKSQLLLYVWMIAKRLKIKDYTNIKCYVFFPLAALKEEKNDDPKKTTEIMMQKTMKQILFTNEDVEENINGFRSIIEETKQVDWNNWDPIANSQMSYQCSFCQILGHKEYCPESYSKSFRFPRKAKVYTKAELKALEKENGKE